MAYVSFLCKMALRITPNVPRALYACLFALVFSSVAFVRRVGGVLAKIAAVGVVVLLFGALVYIFETISTCGEATAMSSTTSGEDLSPVAAPAEPSSLMAPEAEDVRSFEWSTIAEAFGVAAFSNEGIVALASPIFADSNAKSRVQYLFMVFGVIFVCFVLNSSIGYAGLFCSPPGGVPNVITDDLTFSNPLDAFVNLLLAGQIACTFPQVSINFTYTYNHIYKYLLFNTYIYFFWLCSKYLICFTGFICCASSSRRTHA